MILHFLPLLNIHRWREMIVPWTIARGILKQSSSISTPYSIFATGYVHERFCFFLVGFGSWKMPKMTWNCLCVLGSVEVNPPLWYTLHYEGKMLKLGSISTAHWHWTVSPWQHQEETWRLEEKAICQSGTFRDSEPLSVIVEGTRQYSFWDLKLPYAFSHGVTKYRWHTTIGCRVADSCAEAIVHITSTKRSHRDMVWGGIMMLLVNGINRPSLNEYIPISRSGFKDGVQVLCKFPRRHVCRATGLTASYSNYVLST
jgi:hypothetical protein